MNAPFFVALAIVLSACAGPHQTLEAQRPSTEARPVVANAIPAPEQATKTLVDAKRAFDVIGMDARPKERARVIEEVDGWLFASEEQEAALGLLREQVELLRTAIEREVGLLESAALAASDGKQAQARIAEMGRVLRLYPMPETSEQQSRLEKMVAGMQKTSQRTNDIRYLRYNAWAVDQIEAGLARFRELKTRWMNEKEKTALMEACVESTKHVHPSFLEPATLDLYRLLLDKTRKELTEPLQVRLTKELADPTTTRKTPEDF